MTDNIKHFEEECILLCERNEPNFDKVCVVYITQNLNRILEDAPAEASNQFVDAAMEIIEGLFPISSHSDIDNAFFQIVEAFHDATLSTLSIEDDIALVAVDAENKDNYIAVFGPACPITKSALCAFPTYKDFLGCMRDKSYEPIRRAFEGGTV